VLGQIKRYLSEEGEKELWEIIQKSRRGPNWETLIHRVSDSYKQLFAKPETEQYITMMVNDTDLKHLTKKYKLGLLSNGSEAALKRDMGKLYEYFSFTVSEAEKPNTKVYLENLRNFGIDPQNTAYIGDAASDIVMAKAAGSISVAVLSGMGTKVTLAAHHPDLMFQDVAQFFKFLDEGCVK